jgi:HK97 family phage major capsid protein
MLRVYKTETLDERINGLEGKAEQILKEIEQDPSRASDLKSQIDSITETVDELRKERDEREQVTEVKSLREQVTTLEKAIKELRTPSGIFGGKAQPDKSDTVYGPGQEFSFYKDAHDAKFGGSQGALSRMAKALGVEDIEDVKAMTEGTDVTGGFLVNPQISNELIRLRLAAARVRPLFSSIDVTSNTIQIASITGGLTAAWVAELAEKPAADLTFSQLAVSVFTAAGLAVVSNQLLRSATPSIDGLINEELSRRLALLEELAFIDGSGTGQPLGILNTPNVGTVNLSSTSVLDILDAIYDSIVDVQSDYFADPSEILMHPRLWAKIAKARESGTAAQYIIGSGANATGRRASDGTPELSLFGYRVVLSNAVPTTKGPGTDETRVITGNFREGLILDRQGVTLDSSEHVYFTTNQTVFRGEEQVGFTAGRYPKAFSVVGGTGLVL